MRGNERKEVLHASLAALHGVSGWRGVLLLGPSGAGKSDLLLRLLDGGWRLVADDRVIVWASDGRPFGRAPSALAGLLELRGQGMAPALPLPFCEIAAVAELRAPDERQPPAATRDLAGESAPLHVVAPFEASAPARLRRLLTPLDSRPRSVKERGPSREGGREFGDP